MQYVDNIVRIIEKRGLKHKFVALQAGYTPKAFSNMLHGRKLVRPEDIARICEALHTDPNEIYGYREAHHHEKRA